MTRLNWDTVGERYYETGIDRGVLYVPGSSGVAWSGITSVDESPSGGDPKTYFFDGVNYLHAPSREEFRATLSAFYSPREFDQCDGLDALATGLFATQQSRKPFGLSYRTKIGNDTTGPDYAYKIHLVYNALAAPSSRSYNTSSASPEANPLSWSIVARPTDIPGAMPSAHLVIDSSSASLEVLAQLEDILYGSDFDVARMPTPAEVVALFEADSLVFTETRLASPNRTLVEGDWGTAIFTDGARSVLVTRSEWLRTFEQHDVPLTDDFNRTRPLTGWGVAKAGGKWQHVGGTDPGNYSVEPGRGLLTLDSNSITRHAYLGSYDLTDQTVAAAFAMSQRVTPPGGAAYGLTLARVDSSNHYRCKLDVENGNLGDDFARTSASGWGTMTSGQTWSTSGGTGADYTIDGTKGKIIMSAKNSSRRIFSGSHTDGEVLFKVAPSELATGGSYTAAAVLRYKDANNHYLARLAFTTTGVVTLRLQSLVAGVTTDLTSETVIPNDTYVAGTEFWIRAKVLDDQVLARAWKNADPEPTDWLLSVTNTGVTGAGAYGIRAYAFSSNTNPATVNVTTDDFTATLGDGKDILTAIIQKQVAGVFTDLASLNVGVLELGAKWMIEGQHIGDVISMRAWVTGSPRPGLPTLSATDPTYASGRSGVFAFTKSGEQSLTVYVSDFYASGTVVTPPSFSTNGRVYALENPFDGTVPKVELLAMTRAATDDLIHIAMQFINGAPDVYDAQKRHIRGDAHYGPRNADGTLIEGADFNDYMGVAWEYPDGAVDHPETSQIGALDCSGYVRMCFGPMGLGMPIRQTGNDGDNIPRQSFDMMSAVGAGASVIPDTGVLPTDLSALQLGDVVGFDADSDEATSGQIDHVGIYLGLDSAGAPLFVSSRKNIDGPTFSKSGGSSNLTGAGTYPTQFRVARRF